jgi:hypothetical protein
MGGFPLPFDTNTSMVPRLLTLWAQQIPITSCWSTWIAGGFTFNRDWFRSFLSDCPGNSGNPRHESLDLSNFRVENHGELAQIYTLKVGKPLIQPTPRGPFAAQEPEPLSPRAWAMIQPSKFKAFICLYIKKSWIHPKELRLNGVEWCGMYILNLFCWAAVANGKNRKTIAAIAFPPPSLPL